MRVINVNMKIANAIIHYAYVKLVTYIKIGGEDD